MLAVDSLIPNAAVVANPAIMADAFDEAIRIQSDGDVKLIGCRLVRLRYRKARRIIALFDLVLKESATGKLRQQWATGFLYRGGKARRTYKRLNSAAPSSNGCSLPRSLKPFLFLSDLDMLVQLFPYDRHLPNLAQLIEDPQRPAQRLLRESFGPGRWSCEEIRFQPVRYRPGVAATFSVSPTARDLATGQRRQEGFFAKLYRSDSGRQAHEDLGRLHAYWQKRNGRLRIAEPVHYEEETRTSFIKPAAGRCLEDLLFEVEDIAPLAQQTAEALASLHLSDAPIKRLHACETILARAARSARRLLWGCPACQDMIAAVFLGLEERLRSCQPRPSHQDLKVDHIFLNGTESTLIDLDSSARSDPVLDPAALLVRLHAMPELTPLPTVRAEAFADCFQEVYFSHVPAQWKKRLAPAYAAAALKVALYFLQHLEPDWPDKIHHILARALRLLDDKDP